MSFHTTIPERDDPTHAARPAASALVLAVAWCREEPWRVGELLLVPPGPTVWFGRGPSLAGQPPKSPLGQLRAGRWLPSPALSVSAISRHQLSLRALGAGSLVLENAGRCPLTVNDAPVERAEIAPGDLVQLGRQLLFLCVVRPLGPARAEDPALDFPFGEADGHGIVGESAAIWELRRQIAAVAPRPGHVLVSGPSGCGKELVAQALHAHSERGARALVARNAATLPEGLIDAELFGNARNYPNPGMLEREGLIGAADGSTLFLDEIAELPHQAQAHLLRVLDAGDYQRLGETRPRRSDFRLVAATNRDVSSLKHDLLARFSFQIEVPPLDVRREDVPLLARYLLHERPDLGAPRSEAGDSLAPALPLELVRQLLRHPYRTGVRELRALISSAVIGPEGAPVAERAPEIALPAAGRPLPARGRPGLPTPEEVQRCLDENNGIGELTWRALGLSSRFSLMRLIKRYDLEVRRRPGRRA